MMKSVHFLLLALLLPSTVMAYSDGAGACPPGQPAVGYDHKDGNWASMGWTNGSIPDGGYELSIDGVPFTGQALEVGVNYTITVTGNLYPVRGVLFRMSTTDPVYDMTGFIIPDPATTYDSWACSFPVVGTTHLNANDKPQVQSYIMADSPVDIDLDLTVVRSNDGTLSAFYYTAYLLRFVNPTLPPTAVPTPSPTSARPTIAPSQGPSSLPTPSPTTMPTSFPTRSPRPTTAPTPYWVTVTTGTYVGCYADVVGARDLQFFYGFNYNIESCIAQCTSANFLYAGLQGVGVTTVQAECWCDNTAMAYGPSTDCTVPCMYGGGICGGPIAISLYRTLITRAPTVAPTGQPTALPTTDMPTTGPTNSPSRLPTMSPTFVPTWLPTSSPTVMPTHSPSNHPTLSPTYSPTTIPTSPPSASPTHPPTPTPTYAPSSRPTFPLTSAPTPLCQPCYLACETAGLRCGRQCNSDTACEDACRSDYRGCTRTCDETECSGIEPTSSPSEAEDTCDQCKDDCETAGLRCGRACANGDGACEDVCRADYRTCTRGCDAGPDCAEDEPTIAPTADACTACEDQCKRDGRSCGRGCNGDTVCQDDCRTTAKRCIRNTCPCA